MAERPTDGFPRFATNDITLPDGTPNKVPLRTAIENEGYAPNDQPPVQEWNYILDKLNRWIEYLDESSGADASASYPVGSYYFSNSTTNPATSLGFGTWTRSAEGQFIVGEGTGVDANSQSRTFTAGANAGEYEVTLTEQQMPRHDHSYNQRDAAGSGSGSGAGQGAELTVTAMDTTEAGNDQPHTNLPPSFGMYVWLRTA